MKVSSDLLLHFAIKVFAKFLKVWDFYPLISFPGSATAKKENELSKLNDGFCNDVFQTDDIYRAARGSKIMQRDLSFSFVKPCPHDGAI